MGPGARRQRGDTGCQRALPRTSAGPSGAPSSGASGGRTAGPRAGVAGSGGSGTLLQAASIPTMAAIQKTRDDMLIILLEALLAMLVLVGIVWWTMFSGRKGGEPPSRDGDAPKPPN